MPTTREIKIAKSTAASPPSALADGEFGFRTYNGVSYLYIGSSSGNILIAQSGKTAKVLEEKIGIEAISNGTNSVSVTFSSSFSSVNYAISCTIVNTVNGSSASQYSCTVSAQAVDGFTVTLSGNTDTGNYSLHYRCIEV